MNKFLPVVTIDGPSGVGKSTVADLLAKKLDIPHLDTGAMFRYSALVLEENGPTMPDAEVQTKLSKLEFDLVGNGAEAKLYCNGKAIGDEIRTEQVALLASKIAQRPVVRQFMLQSERKNRCETRHHCRWPRYRHCGVPGCGIQDFSYCDSAYPRHTPQT